MSISTEAREATREILPVQSSRARELLDSAKTLSPDQLRSSALELIADETELDEFFLLGGEIAVSLYGELTVTNLLEAIPADIPEAKKGSDKRKFYVIDYIELVEMLQGRARQMALLDNGDPNDPTLDMTAEQRAKTTEDIQNAVNKFMYEDFDGQLAIFLLAASLTGDINLLMNPTDTAKAIHQKHMWLNQAREKLNNAHDKNGIGNTSRVKIVLVPSAETPE